MKTSQYKSIYHILKVQSEKNPELIAIAAPDRPSMSYIRLLAHVEDTVGRINSMGFGRNDRIAVVLPNGPEMAVTFLAVACGATCAPLNPSYSYNEFNFYLTDINARAIIVQSGMDSPAIDFARNKGIPIIELFLNKTGLFALKCDDRSLHVNNAFAESDDIALVLHTSGTTSRPKIVSLTHANVCVSAVNIQAALSLTEKDRSLNIMPLFHIHGLIGSLLSSLAAGGSIVLTPGFNAPKFLDWVAEFKPTWYTAVPTMHQAILARAKSDQKAISDHSLRFIRSCSSALPAQVMSELEETFGVPVIEAYGMTEASHQVASNPLPPGERKIRSVGFSAVTKIAIMDKAGNILPSGEIGEIVIHGENVINGYENNPDANETAFTKGWFRTGDQGYLDDDGYLFITGRIKEIINRGGEKILPQEIDEVLLQHQAIAQAITFSIPHAQLGEEIASAVVFKKNYNASEAGIKNFVATKLADFKIPRRIFFLDEIPKGPTGKPQRIGMAEKLGIISEQTKASVKVRFVLPHNHLEKKLADIWSQILRINRIGIHDDFFYLGGDSLLAAQVIVRIRYELHRELSVFDFFDNPTIASLAKIIESTSQVIEKPSSVLVRIKSGKPELKPIFCMHGCDGNVILYRNLMRYLDSDRPIYGIRMRGLYGEKAPHCSFEEAVSHYIKEIKTVQPVGPYNIIGLRDGGWAALETVRRLIEQGDEVSIVVLIDTGYHQFFRMSNVNIKTPESQIAENRESRNMIRDKNIFYYIRRLFLHLRNKQLTRALLDKLKDSNNEFIRNCYWRFAYSFIARHIQYFRRYIDYENYIRAIYRKCLFNYIPRAYPGKVVMLYPKPRQEYVKVDEWSKLIPEGIEYVELPGGHYSLWTEPNIQFMGEKLKAYLDKAY